MQEKQKEDQPPKVTDEVLEKDNSWSEDQKSHSYYYDDSHGYEVFQPETDRDDSENED